MENIQKGETLKKRNHGAVKHHIAFGRHKVNEKLIDDDTIYDAIADVKNEKLHIQPNCQTGCQTDCQNQNSIDRN
jgi:hypothetical protein